MGKLTKSWTHGSGHICETTTLGSLNSWRIFYRIDRSHSSVLAFSPSGCTPSSLNDTEQNTSTSGQPPLVGQKLSTILPLPRSLPGLDPRLSLHGGPTVLPSTQELQLPGSPAASSANTRGLKGVTASWGAQHRASHPVSAQ